MFAILAALALTDVPDGRLIRDDDACYVITMSRNGVSQPFGHTRQIVRHDVVDGRPVLDVIVHQNAAGGKFDMRDHFTLDAVTLLPIRMDNQRNGKTHVSMTYAPTSVVGTRSGDAAHPSDFTVPLSEPVWDGNLYGLTIAALPLRDGLTVSVPKYQYDSGLGSFEVKVAGSEPVATPDGPVEAWAVDVRPLPEAVNGTVLTYLIAKATRRELGYRSDMGGQLLGGECSGLD